MAKFTITIVDTPKSVSFDCISSPNLPKNVDDYTPAQEFGAIAMHVLRLANEKPNFVVQLGKLMNSFDGQ